MISLNCASYSRWNKIWARATQYLHPVLLAVANSATRVTAYSLQYLDIFIWDGEEKDYDARLLIGTNSEFIPLSVLDKGPLWHAHAGWFIDPATSHPDAIKLGVPDGRLLERMHIEGLPQSALPKLQADGPPTLPMVKLESYSRFDLASAPLLSEAYREAQGDVCFQFMHQANKRLVRAYLTDDAAQRINLDV